MRLTIRSGLFQMFALAALACTMESGEPGESVESAEGALTVSSSACQVDYTVTSEWSTGFGANVTVTNKGAAKSSWNLEFTFPSGQKVTTLWNGSYSQSGANVRVNNASWNGTLGSGQSTSFGFNGSKTGANGDPTGFKLNGVSCGGPSSGSGGSSGGGSGGTSGGGGSSATGGSSSGGSSSTGGTSGSGGSGNLVWRKATLTHYTSYPDPGSEECIVYNGCTWAGYFAALSGKQPESWVQANNIVAVHSKDFNKYRLKTLRIRQGSRQIDAKVYDMCGDSDCNGCCTRNAQPSGNLIDLEKYTMQRFGSGSGQVDWACLDCDE